MIRASVVDLPEPVGPVTSTSPFSLSRTYSMVSCGRLTTSSRASSLVITRITALTEPR